MVDIKYEDGTPVPNPNPVNKNSPKNLSFHVDKRLERYLEKVKARIQKHDKDYVTLVDGYEGAGKSTFAQQIGKVVDPTLDLSRICMTAQDFRDGILSAKKGNTIIYDEAVTGLSAGESITRIGRLLKSLMMQMRQKNLFVIIVLPSIFEFNKYAVLSRAMSLFHVYESKGKMGKFVGYNRKDMRILYLKGKKTHSYTIRSRFTGRFFGKYVINDAEYRKKKEDALMAMEDTDGRTGESKMTLERKILLVNDYLMRKKYENMTQKQYCELLDKHGIRLARTTLAVHVAEVRKMGKVFSV